MDIDCCRATRPLLNCSFGQIGYASTISAGRLNNVGLGIEEPKVLIGTTISGHGASMGVIEERRLRPALPERRRRDGERDGGPRDGDLTVQIRIVFSTISTLHG